jgi:hypothetical protein
MVPTSVPQLPGLYRDDVAIETTSSREISGSYGGEYEV